ncbi:hypothetical protein ANO11243_079870 [Dothideomycetidae sp. 11243]|nr:hypothetical protein ANO11243_079870 [fungal sp. No.11243]
MPAEPLSSLHGSASGNYSSRSVDIGSYSGRRALKPEARAQSTALRLPPVAAASSPTPERYALSVCLYLGGRVPRISSCCALRAIVGARTAAILVLHGRPHASSTYLLKARCIGARSRVCRAVGILANIQRQGFPLVAEQYSAMPHAARWPMAIRRRPMAAARLSIPPSPFALK